MSLVLLRQLIRIQVSLCRNAERIRHTIEKRKHRGNVDGLCNLRLRPAKIAQLLHIFRRGAIRRFRHLGHVFKQAALGGTQTRRIEIAMSDRLNCCFIGSLNTQEVSM